MKKAILLFMVIFFMVRAFGKAEPASYTAAVTRFKGYYNNNHADSIFAMFSPEMKSALPMATFKPTTEQLKAQYGDLVKTEFVKFGESLAVYKATFKNSIVLLNITLNVSNQFTGLLLSPYQDAAVAKTTLDPSITESPILVKTLTGQISGSLVLPSNASGKVPLVIIIGDAGPTDRDGNNEQSKITANPYKLLAYGLGKSGVASIRYDKRRVGQSVCNEKESQLRIDDYSDDVVSLLNTLTDDQRFSKIVLFGHGEGALVGIMAIVDQPVKGYISAEGQSETADKILTEQMKSKPTYQSDEFKTLLDSMRKGKTIDNIDPAIYYIARPSIQPFLMSWCRISPIKGIKSVKMPTLIIQGSTDLPVPLENGEKLKKAKSDATLMVIKGMNHIFKDAPADEEKNLDTYSKPDQPLSEALIPGIVDFVNNKVK